jgi:hypothetical protein
MASTCLWRLWHPTLEWEKDVQVPQDVRARLMAFLEPVWAATADLAAAVTDATDDDLIAVLSPHVLRLHTPAQDRTVAALAAVVRDWLVADPRGPHTDRDRLHAWMAAVDCTLEGKAPAVQWAIVAVFLERVLRALLASPELEDTVALEDAADVLAASMVDLLREVQSRAIPPESYHVM